MTKAGAPMNQSAIWKIENGKPRRRITVDEAIAFAKVFEVPLDELLTPVGHPADKRPFAANRVLFAKASEYLRLEEMADNAWEQASYAAEELLRLLREAAAGSEDEVLLRLQGVLEPKVIKQLFGSNERAAEVVLAEDPDVMQDLLNALIFERGD
jgi:transcriptional regulator with XRE-family HTH domain